MLLKQLTEVYDILDSSTASGETVAAYPALHQARCQHRDRSALWCKGLHRHGKNPHPRQKRQDQRRQRPHHRPARAAWAVWAPGRRVTGFVSDGDGALAGAGRWPAKLAGDAQKRRRAGGRRDSSPRTSAPTRPPQAHLPVPFMGSPMDMAQVNRAEVDRRAWTPSWSVDTTKGNRVINTRTALPSPPPSRKATSWRSATTCWT